MKPTEKDMQRNIRLYYLYRVFCSFILASPIFVLFLLDNNLTMLQIGLTQTIYTVTIMLFNIPSGILTDTLGRRTMMILNTAFFFAGWVVYGFSHSFLGFAIAEILIGIAAAMWQAVGSTFVYETLLTMRKQSGYKKIAGTITTINYATNGIASLLGALIATVSLRLPMLLSAVPVAFALLITFQMREPKRHGKKHHDYVTHLKEALTFSVNHPKISMFITFSAVYGGVAFSVFTLFQPYLQSIAMPVVYFGVIYFIMDMASAASGRYASRIESILGEKASLITVGVVAGLATACMAAQFKYVGAIFPLVFYAISGFYEPVMAEYMHKHIDSTHRGTVMALSSLAGNLLASSFMPLIGYMVDAYSLSVALLLSAGLLLLNIGLLFALYHKNSRRSLADNGSAMRADLP